MGVSMYSSTNKPCLTFRMTKGAKVSTRTCKTDRVCVCVCVCVCVWVCVCVCVAIRPLQAVVFLVFLVHVGNRGGALLSVQCSSKKAPGLLPVGTQICPVL